MYRIVICICCLIFFSNCVSGEQKDMNKYYLEWLSKVKAMPPYSKTTAYTKIDEYKAIVDAGPKIIPLLVCKIKENKEDMDFVLCDAIINIKGWSKNEFDRFDVGKRSKQVVERIDNENDKLGEEKVCP